MTPVTFENDHFASNMCSLIFAQKLCYVYTMFPAVTAVTFLV